MICLWTADHIHSKFLKAVFHKIYLVHSWILCTIQLLVKLYFRYFSLALNHKVNSRNQPKDNVKTIVNEVYKLNEEIKDGAQIGNTKVCNAWGKFLI